MDDERVIGDAAVFVRSRGVSLVESDRSELLLGTFQGEAAVLKRYKNATANPLRDSESQRFAADRKWLWSLSADCPYFLRPLATVLNAPTVGLVLPYCQRQSLDFVLHKHSQLLLAVFARDAAFGLAFAHSKGVVLRDIKPANILISNEGVAQFTDLELAFSVNDEPQINISHKGGPSSKPRRKFEGTPEYMSPELIGAFEDPNFRRFEATFASDLYALAISLNEIATGTAPFSDLQRSHIQLQTVIQVGYTPRAVCFDVLHLGKRPTLLAENSLVASPSLIKKAWHQDQKQRPSARTFQEALMNHSLEHWPRDLLEVKKGEPNPSAATRRRRFPQFFREETFDDNNTEKITTAPTHYVRNKKRRFFWQKKRRVSCAYEGAIGPREFMEDAANVVFWSDDICGLVADGHGGDKCAREACEKLPNLICEAIDKGDSPARALAQFQDDWPEKHKSGACVTGFFLSEESSLHIFHVGDCRMLLFKRDGRYRDVVRPHTVASLTDRSDIVDGRLQGTIGVARALGWGSSRPPGLSAEVDAANVPLETDDVCLVLGTDGLFDALTPQQIRQILCDITPTPDLVAKALVSAALQSTTLDDNVTALVLFFHDPARQPCGGTPRLLRGTTKRRGYYTIVSFSVFLLLISSYVFLKE